MNVKPDIVKTIESEGIKLERSGDCYKALCPLHDDKEPSLVIFPDSQMWKCFGKCDAHGDVIEFIMRLKKMSFIQACRYLKVKPPEKIKDQRFHDIRTAMRRRLFVAKFQTVYTLLN